MRRVTSVQAHGAWTPESATDVVVLDYATRHRKRARLKGEAGVELELDLDHESVLREGDGLVLDNGDIVAVRAAREPLIEVRCESFAELTRLAWHLGMRRVPVELLDGALRIRDEPGNAELVERLGGTARRADAPFHPESGAAPA